MMKWQKWISFNSKSATKVLANRLKYTRTLLLIKDLWIRTDQYWDILRNLSESSQQLFADSSEYWLGLRWTETHNFVTRTINSAKLSLEMSVWLSLELSMVYFYLLKSANVLTACIRNTTSVKPRTTYELLFFFQFILTNELLISLSASRFLKPHISLGRHRWNCFLNKAVGDSKRRTSVRNSDAKTEKTRKLSSIEDRGQTDRILILTCDFQFQSPTSHGSDPHTCKRPTAHSLLLTAKVSQFESQSGNRRTDRRTEAIALLVMLMRSVTTNWTNRVWAQHSRFCGLCRKQR